MITAKTKLIGLIGHPVGHSFSPQIHNNAYKQMDMNYVYLAFDIDPDDIENIIDSAKVLNIQGFNVTIPHKTAVIPYLDEIDETAKKIGAVNTIQFRDGIAKGFNTDGMGTVMSLQNYTDVENKDVLIIGAGGAAKAIAFTLINYNIKSMKIANRSRENADVLINNLKDQTEFSNIEYVSLTDASDLIDDVDIIINTTPIGMYPNVDVEPPIKTDKISSKHTVMDIIYNPLKTNLLKQAQANGATVIDGTQMLINQAIESFKIFTDKTPKYEYMEKVLLRELQG